MKTFKFLIIIFSILSSSLTNAGSASGKITTIYVHAGGPNGQGIIMFAVEDRTSPPVCSSAGGGNEWAFSLNTELGKAMYALLLSAESRDLPVLVSGAGDCADWADRERPHYIRIVK